MCNWSKVWISGLVILIFFLQTTFHVGKVENEDCPCQIWITSRISLPSPPASAPASSAGAASAPASAAGGGCGGGYCG